ncbi:MAG: Gfo/Idh/MocA family oxidoreductase [Candidatus Firestonebacteria bacterium]
MVKIKAGIVGLGRSGWDIHIHLLEQLKDKYQIVAVCDANQSRREEAEKKFNCKSYVDLISLLKDKEVELVIIATPSHLHSQNAIESLKAGKNVVCEKPMATTLKDADLMIETAKKENKILTVFHNRRYAPDFLKVREVINSGKLGRIVLIKMSWNGFARRWDWQTLKKFGGGTLNNTGPHAIDQALHLFGSKEEPEIFCHLEKTLTLGNAEDHIKIIFKGKKSPMLDLEISSACAYPQDLWLVMGTQGGLRGGSNELYWKYFNPAKLSPRKVETTPTPDRGYNSEQIVWEKEESWKLSEDRTPGQLGFYIDLHNIIVNNALPFVTSESARRVMCVIEKCHQMSGV